MMTSLLPMSKLLIQEKEGNEWERSPLAGNFFQERNPNSCNYYTTHKNNNAKNTKNTARKSSKHHHHHHHRHYQHRHKHQYTQYPLSSMCLSSYVPPSRLPQSNNNMMTTCPFPSSNTTTLHSGPNPTSIQRGTETTETTTKHPRDMIKRRAKRRRRCCYKNTESNQFDNVVGHEKSSSSTPMNTNTRTTSSSLSSSHSSSSSTQTSACPRLLSSQSSSLSSTSTRASSSSSSSASVMDESFISSATANPTPPLAAATDPYNMEKLLFEARNCLIDTTTATATAISSSTTNFIDQDMITTHTKDPNIVGIDAVYYDDGILSFPIIEWIEDDDDGKEDDCINNYNDDINVYDDINTCDDGDDYTLTNIGTTIDDCFHYYQHDKKLRLSSPTLSSCRVPPQQHHYRHPHRGLVRSREFASHLNCLALYTTS